MVAISAKNAQERQNTLIDHVLDTITRFDMNQDVLANSVNALLDAVWEDLAQLDQLATDVDRTDPEHPVNVLLDCLQEKVVSAIEAKSDDDFWAYAKENGVVFHERADNDFLMPDELQGGIRANQGNGGEYKPAEEEERTRMVLAALLAMKALGTIDGDIDVTPGGEIREGAVRRRPYNLIEYTAGDVPVQLRVCDEQKQAAYGLRGDNCLNPGDFLNQSDPVTKSFLRSRGGVQIKFNTQWRNTLKRFTEGSIESKPFQQIDKDYVSPRITDKYLHEIFDVYREQNAGENPTLDSDDIYVRDGPGGYVANGDTFRRVDRAMRKGNRGWPKDSPISSLSQWLDKNGCRHDNQITDDYLRKIVEVYRAMHQGKNPTLQSDDIYVRGDQGIYIKNGDKFVNVDVAMRQGNRGWPEDSPIRSLSQWLDENGYRDNQITDDYLREIVDVYRAMHPGKNPTVDSGDIYASDGLGRYVANGDNFLRVNASMRQGNRGWPKDSPIKSLSQWLKANDYAKSKQPQTQATEGHDAAQLRAREGR